MGLECSVLGAWLCGIVNDVPHSLKDHLFDPAHEVIQELIEFFHFDAFFLYLSIVLGLFDKLSDTSLIEVDAHLEMEVVLVGLHIR